MTNYSEIKSNIDYHHIAYPLMREAVDLMKQGKEECIDLFNGGLKGFYLAARGNGMNIEYIFHYFSQYKKALKEFNKEPPKGLEQLIAKQEALAPEIKKIEEEKSEHFITYLSVNQAFHELKREINFNEVFLEIKAINGFLDYCMSVDFEKAGKKTEAEEYYKKALSQKQDEIPKYILRVLGSKHLMQDYQNNN